MVPGTFFGLDRNRECVRLGKDLKQPIKAVKVHSSIRCSVREGRPLAGNLPRFTAYCEFHTGAADLNSSRQDKRMLHK